MKLDKNHFFTTEDLFIEITSKAEKTESWRKANIDYALADKPLNLYSYEFNPEFVLARGSCEGIYMDLSIYGHFKKDSEIARYHIGTVKTLDDSKENLLNMSLLYGECLIAFYDTMDTHLDDMTRLGYDLQFPDHPGGFGFSGISTFEKAVKRWNSVDHSKECYVHGIIRNNFTRKEIRLPEDLPVKNWEEIISKRFRDAFKTGEEELDVVIRLIYEGFQLDFLSEDSQYYDYLSNFMAEHGLD